MTEKINLLIEGGKASGGPPLGPALGPTKADVKEVVKEINEKTKDFEGMELPVEVEVDTETGKFTIEVGAPTLSSIVKKELFLEKLSAEPGEKHVGDMTIDQVIKVSRSMKNKSLAKTDKGTVKEVLGSLISFGIEVDGEDPRKAIKKVEEGEYDAKISGEEKLEEVTKEEILKKEEELQKEIEKIEEAEAEEAAEKEAEKEDEEDEETEGEETEGEEATEKEEVEK